jgi:hypothetical protein
MTEIVPPVVTPPPATPTSWRDTLPDDLKADPSLATFNDPAALAKSYVNAQKLIGKDKISLPDKHATDEDWNNIFSKLGLPKELAEYQVDVEKDAGLDETFINQFKENAHKAGVLPKQAKKLLDWYTKASKETLGAYQNDINSKQAALEEVLKKDWGAAFDKNMLATNLVMKDFGDEETAKFFSEAKMADGTSLQKNPAFLKFMAKIGGTLKEEAIKGGIQERGGDPNALSPDNAMKEVSRIMGDFAHPYYDKNHPNHLAAVSDVQRFMQMAHPQK